MHVKGDEYLHGAQNCPTLYKQQDVSRSAVQPVVYLGMPVQAVTRALTRLSQNTSLYEKRKTKDK